MSNVNEMYDEAERLKDQGHLQEAIDQLEKLLDSDPSHVLSHLALAVLYGRVGRHEQAIEHGKRACELDPTDAFNFTAMSVTYQRAWQGTQHPEYIRLAEDAMARAHAIR
jgi:tetratricopeptide (TPR) repeat protein